MGILQMQWWEAEGLPHSPEGRGVTGARAVESRLFKAGSSLWIF